MTATHVKAPPLPPNCHGQRNSPGTPIGKSPTRIHRPRDPGCSRAGYQGQYEVAPSILPCQHQDQFMAELHKELSQCLVRAGLCGATGTAWSLSRGTRCSCAYLSSWARSPSVESRRKEVAKQPRGDSLMRSSWPHSRHIRSRVQQHRSQSLEHPLPSKAPP